MAEIFPTKDYEHVIITDIEDKIVGIMTHPDVYFRFCEQGLEEWCKNNNVNLIGMTMDFPDQETVLMFRMSWGI